MRALPKGWVWKTVSESVRNISLTGKKLLQREYLESGKIPVVDQGQILIGGYTNQDDLLVNCEPPVIVFGDHTRAIKYIPFPFVAGADGVKAFKTIGIFNSKLFYYFLQAVELPNKGYARHFQYLEKANIPLPPLPEQERIVARLEELLSDLEAGVAALERVRAGVKRYKASVLKAACEGRLTGNRGLGNEDLPELGQGMQVGATRRVAPTDIGDLPDGWRWATLEELSSDANYGTSQKCDYSENEFPVVRIPNIVSGDIDLADLKFAIDGSGLREKDSLIPGDLLIIRTNGSRDLIGKSTLIRKAGKKPLYFASYLIRYKIKDFENVGAWIATIWESPFIRTWLEEVVSTTAGQYNLNIAKLNRLLIPLPPLEKQRRIVAEVERRLKSARAVEAAAEAGVKRAARLRQAVLKSAFEGRL